MMIEQIINSHHRHSLHENLEFMFGCHHSPQVRRWWITTQCFVDVMAFPDTTMVECYGKGPKWATAHVAFEAELLLGRWSYYACKIGWFHCRKVRLLRWQKTAGIPPRGQGSEFFWMTFTWIPMFNGRIILDGHLSPAGHLGWFLFFFFHPINPKKSSEIINPIQHHKVHLNLSNSKVIFMKFP